MAPFYGWGSTASRLEPLRGGSLLFTTKSPIMFYEFTYLIYISICLLLLLLLLLLLFVIVIIIIII